MNLPLIVIGAGGHAKVLVDALLSAGRSVLGLTDADPAKAGSFVLGVPVFGGDEKILTFAPGTVQLVNGIGSVAQPQLRQRVYDSFKARGYRFASVIHPNSLLAREVILGEGVQILAGAIVQAGARLGDNTIVNTRAVVEHDCDIGAHIHLSPGTTICGNVTIGSLTHIGAGATLIQGLHIGSSVLVAAGAVVVHDIPDHACVAGIPAYPIESKYSPSHS